MVNINEFLSFCLLYAVFLRTNPQSQVLLCVPDPPCLLVYVFMSPVQKDWCHKITRLGLSIQMLTKAYSSKDNFNETLKREECMKELFSSRPSWLPLNVRVMQLRSKAGYELWPWEYTEISIASYLRAWIYQPIVKN